MRSARSSDRVLYLLVVALGLLAAFVLLQALASPRSNRRSHSVVVAERAPLDSGLVMLRFHQNQLRFGRGAPPLWLVALQTQRMQQDTTPAPMPDESVHDRLRSYGPNGYIQAVLTANDSVLARWPDRAEPLKVWVQPHPALPTFSTDFVPPVRAAFRTWSELGLGVSFAPVDDSTDADVHVTWIDKFDEPQQIGSTLRVTDAAGWIVAANITLALHAGDGSAYDIYTIQNGGLHEVGHLIGLDHSPDHGDVMAASTAGRQDRLSVADKNTARLLYMLPPGKVR